jgi:hypothetical protein
MSMFPKRFQQKAGCGFAIATFQRCPRKRTIRCVDRISVLRIGLMRRCKLQQLPRACFLLEAALRGDVVIKVQRQKP